MWLEIEGHTLINLDQIMGLKVNSQSPNRPGQPPMVLTALLGPGAVDLEEGTPEHCFGLLKAIKEEVREGKSSIISTREIAAKIARG